MKLHYYSNLELLEIAKQCNTEDELHKSAKSLRYLWDKGENINLELFRRFANIRHNQMKMNN